MKSATLVFEENSVYGSRNGAHNVLLITANDKNNMFLKSKAMRTGVISAPTMLPRSEMLKVERSTRGFTSDPKLTRVQEMKQAGLFEKLSGPKKRMYTPMDQMNFSACHKV